MTEKKNVFPRPVSNTLTDTGESCNRGCCAVIECRPLKKDGELPVTFEVPYESLDTKIKGQTIGNFCLEFFTRGKRNLCQITQKECPNFHI